MKISKYLLLISLLFTSTAHAASATYYVPPAQFNSMIEVMDLGFSNIFGLFRNATASFTFDENAKSLSNLRVALDASSLVGGNNSSQNALATMLGSFQYPEIRVTAPDNVTFSDNKAEVKATVTLHGFSKPVTFQATLNRVGKSPVAGGMWSSEGDAVGLSLRGEFKRADFGLAESADSPGRFGETITLKMEMQGIQQ